VVLREVVTVWVSNKLAAGWVVVVCAGLFLALPALMAPAQEPQAESQGVTAAPRALPLGPLEEPLWSDGQPPVWQPPIQQPPAFFPQGANHVGPPHSGCGCPSCAAGDHGPHFYSEADHLPLYAPTQLESVEATWLPEITEDWHGRPLSAGAFSGVLIGDEILAGELELKPGWFTGIRFGRHDDRRWSWETRLAHAHPDVINLRGPELRREAELFLADTSLQYSRVYGKRLRPYASLGMGVAYLDTSDQFGDDLREFIPTVPIGAGAQYRLDDWLIVHVALHDNVTLGQQVDLDLMHNVTLAGGLEFRFGGSQNTFYPWNPARNGW
jgi:hypothetical protein